MTLTARQNIGDSAHAKHHYKTFNDDKQGLSHCDENENRNLFVLSGAFMATFTSFFALLNLQSSLHQEAGLGIISLSCLNATIIISGIVAPTIIKAVGEKIVLLVSFISHVIYTGTNFYPTFATLIPSSVLLGLTSGCMWTSQGVYLAHQAISFAEKHGIDDNAILNKFNGIFFAMFGTTQITGNLISSLILQQGNYNETSSNETKFCGKHDCPGNDNATTKIEEPERHIVYILLSVFLVFDAIGVSLVAFLLPPLKNKTSSTGTGGIWTTLTSCGRALGDVNLLLLVPMFLFMAMEQAILLTDYTKAFISCPIGIQKLGFIMACYGGSTTFFAMALSRVAKYTGRQFLFAVASLTHFGLFITLYFWMPTADETVFIFIVPIVWGVAEGIWHTQPNILIALIFPEKKESAFANFITWRAVGVTVTLAYGNVLCVSTKLIIGAALIIFAMLLYVIVEIRVLRSRHAQTSDETKRILEHKT